MTVQSKRTVELVHNFLCVVAIHAHHDAVGLHEVVNGRAFFQELWVRSHVKTEIYIAQIQCVGDRATHLFSSTYGHCRLSDHNEIIRHGLSDLIGHSKYVLQICRTVFPWRGTHSNKSSC